jgi:hypothetical protein
MKIDEAIAHALLQGKKVTKRELKNAFWPESTSRSQDSNMLNLCKGVTRKIDPEWIQIMVDKCGVDANFLFGIKPMKE